jgi:hypothetical protein
MRLRFKALFLFVGLCIAPVAATAQTKACAYKGAIVSLANVLLRDLDSHEPAAARFYARDAAFLNMYYAPMPSPAVDAMLDHMITAGVTHASEFAFAYYLSTTSYDEAMLRIGNRLQREDSNAFDLTLMRSLAKAGRYDLAVNMTKGISPHPNEARLLPLALPFVEAGPEERRRLADIADKAGAVVLAGELYASLPDYQAWTGFLKRHFQTLGYYKMLGNFVAFSAMRFENAALPNPQNRSNGTMYRQFMQRTSGIAWLVPGPSLIYQYMAQFSGEPTYASRAALKLKAAYDNHAFKSNGPMEQGWLISYRALAEASAADDPNLMVQRMQQMRIDSRHYLPGSVGNILDTMLATEAIAPWLKGTGSEFPRVPDLASDRLKRNWQKWQAVARALRGAGELDGLDTDPELRGMAADLLYAKGDAPRLVTLISMEKNIGFRDRLAEDFMSRLDRLCDSSLYFPGEGLFLRNMSLYRFEIVPQQKTGTPPPRLLKISNDLRQMPQNWIQPTISVPENQ